MAVRMVKKLENPLDPLLFQLDDETLVGSSAAVAVLFDNQRLFVANAGDVRVVVCSTKSNGQIKAVSLSVDHLGIPKQFKKKGK